MWSPSCPFGTMTRSLARHHKSQVTIGGFDKESKSFLECESHTRWLPHNRALDRTLALTLISHFQIVLKLASDFSNGMAFKAFAFGSGRFLISSTESSNRVLLKFLLKSQLDFWRFSRIFKIQSQLVTRCNSFHFLSICRQQFTRIWESAEDQHCVHAAHWEAYASIGCLSMFELWSEQKDDKSLSVTNFRFSSISYLIIIRRYSRWYISRHIRWYTGNQSKSSSLRKQKDAKNSELTSQTIVRSDELAAQCLIGRRNRNWYQWCD